MGRGNRDTGDFGPVGDLGGAGADADDAAIPGEGSPLLPLPLSPSTTGAAAPEFSLEAVLPVFAGSGLVVGLGCFGHSKRGCGSVVCPDNGAWGRRFAGSSRVDLQG